MKIFNLTLFLPALVVAGISICFSCSKDLGNYDYSPIDTLDIINLENTYNIEVGKSPDIYPELSFKLAETTNEEDFAYEWISYNKSTTSTTEQRRVIATTKNLTEPLPLTVGTYPTYFVVTQKSTGVTWSKSLSFVVSGAFKLHGWFVLNEMNNSSRLDYFEDDNTNWHSYPNRYQNFTQYIYDEATQFTLSGTPKSLANYVSRDYINTEQNKRYLYINTSDATQKINITDGFVWDKEKYLFTNETIFGQPTKVDRIIPTGSNSSFSIADNTLYQYYYTYGTFYGTPVNRTSGGSPFNMSPHVVSPHGNALMYVLVYDEDEDRFMRTAYNTTYVSALSSPNAVFDLANIGMDMVWGDFTAAFAGQAVYIFKKADAYYLARISYTWLGTATPVSITEITNELPGLASAEHFAIDQQYGYLFYVSGDKLYEYDMDSKVLIEAYTLGGKKVSMLKTQDLVSYYPGMTSFNNNSARWHPVGYSIIMATYDENAPDTSGELHFFEVKPLVGGVEDYPFSPFKDLGKVIDVTYPEVA